jgi:hypothetical protein
LSVGGSAGHSNLSALEIEEGSHKDQGGRRWEVTVRGASAAIAENIEQRETAKEEQTRLKQEKQIVTDAAKLLSEYRKRPEGDTEKAIRERARLNGIRGGPANDRLLADQAIEPCQIVKNGRSYDGFKAASTSQNTSGSERVTTGSGLACPDDEHRAGLGPLKGARPGPAHRDIENSLFEVVGGSRPDDRGVQSV